MDKGQFAKGGLGGIFETHIMIENKLLGREIVKKPTCPFCEMLIEKPKELSTRMPGEMPVGSCSCGAVYACDETGHNLGSAMIEALVFGCNMDTDLAWGLLPEDDYREEIVEHYDYVNHTIVPGEFFEGRRIAGALYFIRLHDDVQEVTSEGVRKRLDKATPHAIKASSSSHTGKGSLSKKEIEKLVKEFKVDQIVSAAGEDKKIIRNLQRLLYSGDHLFRKRAAEILGQVSAVIAENNPGTISKLLQRLFYAITDTAASSWGAFEAIGEILSHKIELFAGYIPQLYQFLADETRRPQVLQTLGRIAKSRPDLMRKVTFHFIPYLSDSDPLVRGYAAWLMGCLSAAEAREDLEKLREDPHEIHIYENGQLEKKTVGDVASGALQVLSAKPKNHINKQYRTLKSFPE